MTPGDGSRDDVSQNSKTKKSAMSGPRVLETEEYVEQAYFFRTFRERLGYNLPTQEILLRIRDEILSTTQLPLAIDFLNTEMKHSGVLGPAMERISHYFTHYQAF